MSGQLAGEILEIVEDDDLRALGKLQRVRDLVLSELDAHEEEDVIDDEQDDDEEYDEED